MLRFEQFLSDMTGRVFAGLVPQREDQQIASIRDVARTLAKLPPNQFREQTQAIRNRVSGESVDSDQVRIQAFALMTDAIRRTRGIELYSVQLKAAMVLARGAIAEMQTGEGKTYSCAPAAYLHALTNRGVHVATPNSYLSNRDYELLLPAYQELGVSVGLLQERAAPVAKRNAYRCDITYGTAYEFGFDYLRDQLTLRQAGGRPLGEGILDSLAEGNSRSDDLVQRGLYFSIIDEVDNVLLDDATSPLILSGAASVETPDVEVYDIARRAATELQVDEHYRIDPAAASVELTESGIARIHRQELNVPIQSLRRTWMEYVEQALSATMLRRDVHYVIDDEGAVQIVDSGTGRIYSDRTWRAGLHQAVEAKEGVRITAEKGVLAQITRQRFARLYERLSGLTGTAAGCEREFRQVYKLQTQPIPLRTRSCRDTWPTRFFVDQQSKRAAIVASVEKLHAQQRPVLIGARSIVESEHLAELFAGRAIGCRLLNGRQDASEAAVIALAGQQKAVTIATSLAGRGTDILLGPGVAELGGLHVIVSQCNDSARVDRQLIGRCARQGDPGSSQTFVSAEDTLIQLYGPWLAHTIARHAGADGEFKTDLSAQIRRIQQSAERSAFGSRCALLRRDLQRDSLVSRNSLDS